MHLLRELKNFKNMFAIFHIPYSKFNKLSVFSFILAFLFSVSLALSAVKAEAAELFIEPSEIKIGIGSTFPVKIFLNSLDDKVNALQVFIKYPKSILKLKDWNNGDSIINFWIQNPALEAGQISFQGIIPGGYQKEKGLLLTLDFEALAEGKGTIYFGESSQALLNDSEGTKASLKLGKADILISSKGPSTQFLKAEDALPPESFTPFVSSEQAIFNGQYFLVFATQDKQSGIDYYEVQESSRGAPDEEMWEIASSPYLLKDQTRESYIYIKAVDKGGNIRIEKIYPASYKPFYERFSIYLILEILALMVFILFYRKFKRQFRQI